MFRSLIDSEPTGWQFNLYNEAKQFLLSYELKVAIPKNTQLEIFCTEKNMVIYHHKVI